MPVRVSALITDRKTTGIDFDGETLSVTYRPSAINAAQEERELADKATGHVVLAVNKSLAEMIVSWDLQDDEGNPLPVDEETLRPLGIDVVQRIYNGIIRDALPNRTPPGPSSNGSSPAAG